MIALLELTPSVSERTTLAHSYLPPNTQIWFMIFMINALKDFCQKQGFDCTYWIAYSGGLDSHVLLHLFSRLRSEHPLKLCAVYVNHGLSQNADAWALHCKKICADLQVDFLEQKIQAKSAAGESQEEVARKRRYAAFSDLLATEDLLVTAHHQDDQAETLLIQLCRGAGPKGLAAMPSQKVLGQGFQVRPLLDFARDDLKHYADAHQLKWIEDESNTNLNFSRNFIRHKVLPVLKERWPTVSQTLTRVSVNCAEAQVLLDWQAERDWQEANGSAPTLLSVARLLLLDPLRQRQLLRYWLSQQGIASPGSLQIHQIQRDLLQARSDKTPLMVWNGTEIRRFRDDLYVLSEMAVHDANQILPWDFAAPLWIPGFKKALLAEPLIGQGLKTTLSNVTIRFRQGGEVCRMPGRQCRHRLKNLFQEWQVPYWERDRIPLVYVGEQLVAVLGFYIEEGFAAKDGETGYALTWDKK
ncbi:MAG: tRNA lysidine(34) synthetase TilS [Gammaproteobacteria bacterium]|nr:tRNA lysidine(34) synthetase TilS [Gammaproteobacteria bacterium]